MDLLKNTFPGKISNPYAKRDFHIDTLRDYFQDLARPNQFKVWIQPPPLPAGGEWDQNMMILAKAASIPSIEIEEILFERAGHVMHIPGNKMNYGDVTITFWADVDYTVRTLFNIWQKACLFNWFENDGNSYSSNVGMALAGEVKIIQYNSKQEAVYSVTLTDAWPKSISEMSLSMDSDSQALDFSVTFAYTHQEITTPD